MGGHTTGLHASVEKMITGTNKALAEMRQVMKTLREGIKSKDVGQSRQQPNTGSSGPPVELSQKNRTCYYCGKERHIKKKCRSFLKFKEQMKSKEGQAGHDSGKGEVRKVSLGSMEVANQTGQSNLFVQAFVNNRSAKLLIDTGATLSIVALHVVPDIKVDEHDPDISVADGSPLKIKGTATLTITINGDTM